MQQSAGSFKEQPELVWVECRMTEETTYKAFKTNKSFQRARAFVPLIHRTVSYRNN